jgi:hypothetical protein
VHKRTNNEKVERLFISRNDLLSTRMDLPTASRYTESAIKEVYELSFFVCIYK